MAKSLGEQVKTGYIWTLVGTVIGQPFTFVIGIALARILSPSDFGVIASCLLFTEIGSTVVSASFVSALIQKKDMSPLELSTGFVLQLIMGVVMASLLVAVSPWAAWLMGRDLVAPVLSVLAFNLIILAVSSTPSLILRRNLDFRLLSLVGLVDLFIYGVVTLALALAGFGVWSLVVGRVISHVTNLVQLTVVTKWRPNLQFSRAVAASLLSVAAQFAGKHILNDLSKKIDYLIVGWKLGVEPLGFYSRAAYLMTIPIERFSTSLGTVLFPSFSKIQEERKLLVHGVLKATTVIAMTTFPLLLGLLLVAQNLIPLVYGEKWLATVVPLQIICFAGLFYAVDSPVVALIDAAGFLKDEIRRQCIHIGLLCVFVLSGAQWGLFGVAWGVVAAAAIYWCFMIQLLKTRVGLSLGSYLESLYPAAMGGLIMVIVVRGFQWAIEPYWSTPSFEFLTVSILLGGLSYFLALVVIRMMVVSPLLLEAFRDVESWVKATWMSSACRVRRGLG
jgi:O-antigen/teichoic acid export membrane protein